VVAIITEAVYYFNHQNTKEGNKMTQELKPVAMIPEDEMQCIIDGHTAIVIPVGDQLPDEVCTLLYALPATHRIVSVELLQATMTGAYPFETKLCEKIRAIIDKEPT